MREINHFNDFIQELRSVGFTIGGENGEGVFTLSDAFGESIAWHTEDPDCLLYTSRKEVRPSFILYGGRDGAADSEGVGGQGGW